MSSLDIETARSAADPSDAADLDRAAFDRTAAERSAKRLETCPQYALDAFFAAGRALWIVPRVAPYRGRLLALAEYSIRPFDAFGDYAHALCFVQTELLRRVRRQRQLPRVAAEGWRLRRLMMSYAESLSYKGLIAPELIVRLRQGSGYRDLVEDLSVLVQELQSLPEGKTGPDAPVTAADLTRASEIAQEIHLQVGNGVDPDPTRATLLDERRKLGALLLEAHSEILRGISYLRWNEGDASRLVPSLYVPPGAREPRDVAADVPDALAAPPDPLPVDRAATPHVVHPDDLPFAAE